ncbi:30S ribosomal protein S2 [bacterium]|nr:30S ribosomal protein S2 [bacterium]
MSVISIQELLEAGVHFGHQRRKRNPKMIPFIFEERKGIHIIDLRKTQRFLDYATQFARLVAQKGGKVLFVCTKLQSKTIVADQAKSCEMPYVCERWLGGTLTNLRTIRQSVRRMNEIEDLQKKGLFEKLPKKEQAVMSREYAKFDKNLCGLRDLQENPAAIFIVDVNKERIAVTEAKKLGIPVIALCDTNGNPDNADFVIPGNDDTISSVTLIATTIAKAVNEGRVYYEEVEKQRKERELLEKEQEKAQKQRGEKRGEKRAEKEPKAAPEKAPESAPQEAPKE